MRIASTISTARMKQISFPEFGVAVFASVAVADRPRAAESAVPVPSFKASRRVILLFIFLSGPEGPSTLWTSVPETTRSVFHGVVCQTTSCCPDSQPEESAPARNRPANGMLTSEGGATPILFSVQKGREIVMVEGAAISDATVTAHDFAVKAVTGPPFIMLERASVWQP